MHYFDHNTTDQQVRLNYFIWGSKTADMDIESSPPPCKRVRSASVEARATAPVPTSVVAAKVEEVVYDLQWYKREYERLRDMLLSIKSCIDLVV